jgi:hypothetical protein
MQSWVRIWVTLPHLSSSSTVLATMNGLRFPYSPFANSITKRTVTNNVHTTKPTPWRALRLVDLPPQMHSLYNPRNKQFYKPDSYCINPSCLPTSVYPNIKYNSSLFCYLLCDKNPHMEEKYPPGTQIEWVNPSTSTLLSGTVMDIPFPASSSNSPPSKLSFTVLFDSSTTTSIPLQDIALLIPPPPVDPLPNGDL